MGWRDWRRLTQNASRRAWGEDVRYRAVGSLEVTRAGVFSDAHEVVELQEEGEVSTRRPVLRVFLADFPDPPKQEDTLTLVGSGKAYIVDDVRPDGHGALDLILTEADT